MRGKCHRQAGDRRNASFGSFGRLVVGGVSLVLLLGACGGGSALDDGTAAVAAAPAQESGSDLVATPEPTAATTEDVQDNDEATSPLRELLGIDIGGFEDSNAADLALEGELEMQECMQDLGFEYTPVVDESAVPRGFTARFDPSIDVDSRAFAETYGLGISTLVDQQIEQRAAQVARENQEDDLDDPNIAYRATLSEAGQAAYDAARSGPEDQRGPGGCEAEVRQSVGRGAFTQFRSFLVEFPDYREDLSSRMEADQRIVAITDDYARCMADEGYSFADEAELRAAIQAEWNPLRTEIFGARGRRGGQQNEADATAAPGFRAPEITAELRVGIDALAEKEITLAVVSWDCADGHGEVQAEVRHELEQRFIDENQAAITAFAEAQAR